VLPPRRHDRSVQEALRTAGQDGKVGRLPWAQPSWLDLADTAHELGPTQPLAANLPFASIRTRFSTRTKRGVVAIALP
jgi:hypothetical protein